MALADTPDKMLWEHLDKALLQDVDLILSCGDLPAEYLSFITCFTKAPVLYVHGNHDAGYERKPPEGCECIDGEIFRFQGIRILGLGGSMRYKPGPCMYTEKEMARRIFKLRFKLLINRGFDILLTHSPAYQLGDEDNLPHRGFKVFLKLLDRYQPKFMVHGHVHQSYCANFIRVRTYGKTTVINADKRCIFEI